jgi:hypothetical protein
MRPPAYRQLIIEAAIDGSVIHGTLSTPTGQQRAFHGWIELNSALEALLTARGDDVSNASLPIGRSQHMLDTAGPTRCDANPDGATAEHRITYQDQVSSLARRLRRPSMRSSYITAFDASDCQVYQPLDWRNCR